jgi:hypothetical protein
VPIVDLETLKLGQIISFQSKEVHDLTTKTGTIKAIGGYDVIKDIVLDVVPRYQAIRKQFPSMAPIDELEFFVVELYQDGKTTKYAIAKDWIEPTSVQIIEQVRTFKVILYDVDERQINEALDLLRIHGFKCSKD